MPFNQTFVTILSLCYLHTLCYFIIINRLIILWSTSRRLRFYSPYNHVPALHIKRTQLCLYYPPATALPKQAANSSPNRDLLICFLAEVTVDRIGRTRRNPFAQIPEMQGLVEAVTHPATAFGWRINASKTKVMSALIPGEQRQALLLDGEHLEDVAKLKCLGSMFVANGQSTEAIRSRINLARAAFSRLQSCLSSRREISLRTEGRVF